MTEDNSIIVSIISLIGTVIGSITGILVANKLTTFRIEQLEKKIDKYADSQDDIKERLVITEQSTKSAHRRIDGLVAQLRIPESRNDG